MGAILAGVFGMAVILLVIGLGWHVVWNGITKGAMTVKEAILQAINYYTATTPSDNNNHQNNSSSPLLSSNNN